MSDNQFSVCLFFNDGSSEYARRWVSAEDAGAAFKRNCTSIAAKTGIVVRVIITDGGDCINAEWKRGEGITFPPQR